MSPLVIRSSLRFGVVAWVVSRVDGQHVATFDTLAEAEQYVMEHGAPHKAKT